MKALGRLARGMGTALARPHLVALLVCADLGVALVAVAPVHAALDASLSARVGAGALARGFDFAAFLDFLAARPDGASGFSYAFAAALGFAWLVGALAAAGWLSASVKEGFFHGIGKYGFRFVRVAVVAAAALYGLERGRLFVEPIVHAWAEATTSAWTALGLDVGLAALHVLLVLVVLSISDLAKALLHGEDRRSALLALGAALWFFVRRPVGALGIGLAGVLLQAALFFGAGLATDVSLGSSLAGLLVPLALGQVFVALRVAAGGNPLCVRANGRRQSSNFRLSALDSRRFQRRGGGMFAAWFGSYGH